MLEHIEKPGAMKLAIPMGRNKANQGKLPEHVGR
jgi:hypothetical protein